MIGKVQKFARNAYLRHNKVILTTACLTLFCICLKEETGHQTISFNAEDKKQIPMEQTFKCDESSYEPDPDICREDWTSSKNIWMLEFGRNGSFVSQRLCAIESYASKLKDWCVRVIFLSDNSDVDDDDANSDQENCNYLEVQKTFNNSFRNIAFHSMKIDQILKLSGLILHREMEISELKMSANRLTHISDVLRLVVLYSFGGIYSDTDAIFRGHQPEIFGTLPFIPRVPRTKRKFERFTSSFMGFQVGHPLLKYAIERMFDGYESSKYGSFLDQFTKNVRDFCRQFCLVSDSLLEKSSEDFNCCDVTVMTTDGVCREIGQKIDKNCSFYHYTSSYCPNHTRKKKTVNVQKDNYILTQVAREHCPLTVRTKKYFYNQCTFD